MAMIESVGPAPMTCDCTDNTGFYTWGKVELVLSDQALLSLTAPRTAEAKTAGEGLKRVVPEQARRGYTPRRGMKSQF